MLDHQVQIGNPADAPQLVPAVKRVIQRTGRVPGAVAADRGYGEASVDDELAALGVGRVAIPRRGKTSGARRQVEHTRPFRRLVKWRTGCEGGSHSSSAATAGTGPCWTASTARGSGAGTACWHTTWTGWPG